VRAGRDLERVIYLGGLVPDADDLSTHLASRAEVGEILREGLPTVEFRAGPVIGSGSASFEMVRYLTERLPAMIAPRWILNEVQPIAVRDVLAYLEAGLTGGELGIYSVGTDALTFKGMMLGFARVRGLTRIIVPVPVLAPGLAALWVGFVTPIPNRLAVPLIQGVVHPVVADTARPAGLSRHRTPRVRKGGCQGPGEDFQGPGRHPLVRGSGQQHELRGGRRRRHGARGAAPRQLGATRGGVPLGGLAGGRSGLAGVALGVGATRHDGSHGGRSGLRRGRRHPTEVLPGDAVDFWRVEAVEPPHRLRLRAEMKVPGKAWLEWDVEPIDGGSRLVQTALFAPIGLTGHLYWNMLYPVHRFIFSDMVAAIVRDAEAGRLP
jgi:hypothetical protein